MFRALVLLLVADVVLAAKLGNGLGVCLRETLFGNDIRHKQQFRHIGMIFDQEDSQQIRIGSHLYARASSDNGLITVIGSNGAFNLGNLVVGGGGGSTGPSHDSNNNNGSASGSSTTPTSDSQSSSQTSESSKPTATGDSDANLGAHGTYSQEPSDSRYTCKSDFVDFSKKDAMSKFDFVWCPQNSRQTSNSVEWTLTQQCGTTMIYPYDFHYGKIEARIRIGVGSGVVTALLLIGPPPSDEIDFEWVGKAPNEVQTMYYVKAQRIDVLPNVFASGAVGDDDLSHTFHNYGIELNKDSVKWFVDGKAVRTLTKGSRGFPTYANRARMGIWDGTQTGGWAGTVDWSHGPFTAEMQWFKFTPYC